MWFWSVYLFISSIKKKKTIFKKGTFQSLLFHPFTNKALGYCFKSCVWSIISQNINRFAYAICIIFLKAFLEFSSEDEARSMVHFYSGNVIPSVCGKTVKIYHSMTYPTIQVSNSFLLHNETIDVRRREMSHVFPNHYRVAKLFILDTSPRLKHQMCPFWRLQSRLGKSDDTIWIGHVVR